MFASFRRGYFQPFEWLRPHERCIRGGGVPPGSGWQEGAERTRLPPAVSCAQPRPGQGGDPHGRRGALPREAHGRREPRARGWQEGAACTAGGSYVHAIAGRGSRVRGPRARSPARARVMEPHAGSSSPMLSGVRECGPSRAEGWGGRPGCALSGRVGRMLSLASSGACHQSPHKRSAFDSIIACLRPTLAMTPRLSLTLPPHLHPLPAAASLSGLRTRADSCERDYRSLGMAFLSTGGLSASCRSRSPR